MTDKTKYHPYSQTYLEDAMRNLAEATEAAKIFYQFDLNYFMDLFILSGVAQQFENGNPKYLAGKSGKELVDEVVYRIYEPSKVIESSIYLTTPDAEYWSGWVLAYYQWCTGMTFKQIRNIISLEEMLSYYNPYHEMDEDKIVELINRKINSHNDNLKNRNFLQTYRKIKGLSQSELAKEANVNLRTLQQYEIGAKDLRKASVSTVLSICDVLDCTPKDLLGWN